MWWIVIAACVALLLRYALDRAIRAGVERALRARSWGSEWAGGCFHVLQTNAPGCEASYADDATVTLRVR
jgi:hypothetical protein